MQVVPYPLGVRQVYMKEPTGAHGASTSPFATKAEADRHGPSPASSFANGNFDLVALVFVPIDLFENNVHGAASDLIREGQKRFGCFVTLLRLTFSVCSVSGTPVILIVASIGLSVCLSPVSALRKETRRSRFGKEAVASEPPRESLVGETVQLLFPCQNLIQHAVIVGVHGWGQERQFAVALDLCFEESVDWV